MRFRRGSKVWVEDKDTAWAAAEVSDFVGNNVQVVTLTGKKVLSSPERLFARDADADYGGVDDMTKLAYLNEPGVLDNLKKRYALNEIYTYTGSILIAVNPFTKLPHLYNVHMMEQYKGAPFGELSPHVFAVADASYRAMMSEAQSQSILVSGESGAGKTETTKLIMQYLTYVGGRAASDDRTVEQQVLESNPLLEAFGNARTVRNDNSSRFGKFVEIQFDANGRISGAAIRTYLLERSRVVQITHPERNYHCFYQLCASGKDADNYKLGHPSSFHYLNQSKIYELDGVSSAEEYMKTRRAMDIVGISNEEQEAIFRTLAAILHLGNIEFSPGKEHDSSVIKDHKSNFHMQTAASLFIYDLSSSKEERDSIKTQKRKEYENLRRRCRQSYNRSDKSPKTKEISEDNGNEDSQENGQILNSPILEDTDSATHSPEVVSPLVQDSDHPVSNPTTPASSLAVEQDGDGIGITCENASDGETESSDSESSEEADDMQSFLTPERSKETDIDQHAEDKSFASKSESSSKSCTGEDFATWQRIIRLDAIRANAEWIVYSPSQAAVSEIKARRLAESVRLHDYDHLEPCRIFHAARLVSILEAYALLDPEIGYCQGMSDLLSPIVSMVEEDHEAFWCFVGFMKKACHNFRLDEVGIRRQLNIVSKIIKGKDSHLYRHLEKLQAEDCFFVYRMVVVLFRRELNFEQTLCLWEVMWADQAAIRAGIAKSAWGRMRLRAPPTDDLLLYAIAACVLQRRKLIVEKYSSMDEILRECNSMAGHLDVWKLLDDAHDLVVSLHDKI